jgi:methionyl-tRNA formyltransferase
MNNIKALILCNNPIAIPGIKEFLFYDKIAAVVVTNRNKDMQHILQPLLSEKNVPLVLITKKNYQQELLSSIEKYSPTIGIMMTFPFIITPQLLAVIPNGFVNFHYGLLPQCRGPQPILRHLLNNDTHAGITIHKVDEGIDTGEIISQEKMVIDDSDTYGTLQAKLAYLGAKQAANLLKILSFGTIIPSIKQNELLAAYYQMPTATELTINWQTMTAQQIIRLVNTCNPWNKGAGTLLNNWFLGIVEAEIIDEAIDGNRPGTILHCDKQNGLVIKTSDNKKIKINIIYTNEGFFSGYKLANFGVKEMDMFS